MKIGLFVLTLLLLLPVLAFGSGEKEEAKATEAKKEEVVTITMFHTYGEGSKREARNNWFEAMDTAFPNIKVERTRYKLSQNHQKILSAVAAGTPPDIVSNHYYYFPHYSSRGLLEPLEPWFKKNGQNPDDIFFPAAMEISEYKGTLYSVPQFIYSRALLYNKGLYKNAGLDPEAPPKDWDEQVAHAKAITKWKGSELEIAGFRAPRIDEKEHMVNYFIMMLWQQGGEIFNADRSKVIFDSPQGVKALQFYAELFQKHKVSTPSFGAGTRKAQIPFARNLAGMKVAGNFDLVFLRQTAHDVKAGAALLPKPKGGAYVSIVDGFNVGMLTSSKHKEACWKILELTASKEAQVNFAKLSFNFPARRDASKDPFFTSDAELVVFSESMGVGKAIPAIGQWTEIASMLSSALESVLVGDADAEKALKQAAKTINSEVLK
jgi:ABC-type glycerol-3-phosphate transport system substrate-binding protein